MKILQPATLFSPNNPEYIFLDTNIFIAALADEDFLKFLIGLRRVHHVLFTIPQVIYEFARGTNSIEEYNTRVAWLRDLVDTVFPIDKYLENGKNAEFILLMRKLVEKGGYVDFLLCLCNYVLPRALIFTGDHKAMTMNLFERKQIITTDDQRQIQTFGFYQIDQERVNKELSKL